MSALKVTLDIPLERIASLLCCAFEGGSNYWYMIERFKKPNGDPERWGFRFDDPQPILRERQIYKHIDYPLNAGGSLLVSDAKEAGDEKKRQERLDLNAIERGMSVFLSKYLKHFADFMAENEDACTGDVFLQCCLFGEAVYG